MEGRCGLGLFQEGTGRCPDSGAEFGWFEDFCVGAPAEDPAFDFLEAAEFELEFDPLLGIGKGAGFLRGMPLPFTHELCGKCVESDADLVAAFS